MSKQVKIGIGVVAIVLLFGCFLVGLAGFAVSRSRNLRTMARPPQSATQLEVRLLDDNEDGIPDRAVAVLPGPAAFGRNPGFDRGGRFDQGFPGHGAQLDVRLIDDDGDGVPDRGLLDLPAGSGFEPRFESPRTFGRGFDPGWDQGRFTSRRFTPFVILGGLFRLAILAAVLAGLANKEITAAINIQGGRAVGISGVDGAIIESRRKSPEMGYVGEVVKVNIRVAVPVVLPDYIVSKDRGICLAGFFWRNDCCFISAEVVHLHIPLVACTRRVQGIPNCIVA